MFTERSYVIVLLLYEFMTFFVIVRLFDFFPNMNTYKTGLMFSKRIFCRQMDRFQAEIELINYKSEMNRIDRKPQHMKLCRLQPWALLVEGDLERQVRS